MSKVRLNWNIAEEVLEIWQAWLDRNNIEHAELKASYQYDVLTFNNQDGSKVKFHKNKGADFECPIMTNMLFLESLDKSDSSTFRLEYYLKPASRSDDLVVLNNKVIQSEHFTWD